MLGNKTGSATFAGDIIEVRGSPYNVEPYDPSRKVVSTVGSGVLTFSSATSGTFNYNAKGVARTVAITRASLGGPTPVCSYEPAPDLAAATNLQDIWWGGAAQDGWGINFTHEGSLLYATWYTFDSDGSPLWLAALMSASGNRYQGDLLRFTGPAFGPSFDPSQVRPTTLGTATLDIANGNAATWHYTIGGNAVSKPLTRFVFYPPAATVCR
jgi:hypothetical protein